jgi:hypothetical protein
VKKEGSDAKDKLQTEISSQQPPHSFNFKTFEKADQPGAVVKQDQNPDANVE